MWNRLLPRGRGAAFTLATASVLVAVTGATAAAAPASPAQALRACKPVVNPYPNSRYEGVNLTRVRATGVSCRGARWVARRAHRKALAQVPSPSGIIRLSWRGWTVTGNLRGSHDRYLARRGQKRVRWRF